MTPRGGGVAGCGVPASKGIPASEAVKIATKIALVTVRTRASKMFPKKGYGGGHTLSMKNCVCCAEMCTLSAHGSSSAKVLAAGPPLSNLRLLQGSVPAEGAESAQM